MEVAVSNFKIQDISNLLTTAERNIELNGECGCISGSIRNVNNIELDFEFIATSDIVRRRGQAKIELSNVSLEYRLKPLVHSTSESFHDQGKLGFYVEYLNATAEETKHELYGSNLDELDQHFG